MLCCGRGSCCVGWLSRDVPTRSQHCYLCRYRAAGPPSPSSSFYLLPVHAIHHRCGHHYPPHIVAAVYCATYPHCPPAPPRPAAQSPALVLQPGLPCFTTCNL
eukprot:458986-Prymnesium_polylepis.1